jgi:hypothetical protein
MLDLTYQTSIKSEAIARQSAVQLYLWKRGQGWPRRLWLLLTGHSGNLLDLTSMQTCDAARSGRAAGITAVPIVQIRGSEGRCADFDADFRPRRKHCRDRWLSVATARIRDIPLPRVALIQLGDTYFVRDGHHRISVARALGETYIDAEVIVWKG